MEQSERAGFVASGAGHAALLLWALLGGFFNARDMSTPVTVTQVSLMSSAQFDALQAAAPKALQETPPALTAPKPPGAEPSPKPVTEAVPKPPGPQPEPQAQPDAAPAPPELTPPDTQVTDRLPDQPATPVTEPVEATPRPSAQPNPKAAPRVAPDPTETPVPDAPPSDQPVTETTPVPSEQPVPEKPPEKAAGPQDSGEVIKTEDNKDQTKLASAAPLTSARPKAKPTKAPPKPAPAAQPADTAPADQPATDQAAVDTALAEALGGAASDAPQAGTGTAPSGPPMTGGEKDALVVAVKQCWNVGSLSTDALNTVVTVGVAMGQDGKPDPGSIRMIGFEGGDEASANLAYEAARRAILICAHDGYPLPAEKYEQWKDIEIVFNPAKMRLK